MAQPASSLTSSSSTQIAQLYSSGTRSDKDSPVASQLALLRTAAAQRFSSPKQIQMLYQSTILICAVYGCAKETAELLLETEEKKVFEDAPEQRAKLFSSAIQKLIEKGFHDKGYELYNEALGRGMWNDYPSYRSSIEEMLREVGYRFGN